MVTGNPRAALACDLYMFRLKQAAHSSRPQHHHGMRFNAFAATDKTKLFSGRRLHAHGIERDLKVFRNDSAHGIDMWSQARLLSHDGDVGVAHNIATGMDERQDFTQ